MPRVNPEHLGLLKASLRAPSAHNAQPWIIKPLDDGQSYELHYHQGPDLPEDPNDKDTYLTMGALVETMALQAPNFKLDVVVKPVLTRDRQDFFIATVSIVGTEGETHADALSEWVSKRATNRNSYLKDPLPPALEDKLKGLGNVLVEPSHLKDAVLEASMRSWASTRYVKDLQHWLRKNVDAPDGLSVPLMNLTALDTIALDFAFWRGSFRSKLMQRIFSSSEVSMFAAAPKVAVLSASEMSPAALFDAGRRLLRSWVEITAAGYSYQPYSVGVDDETSVKKVGQVAGIAVPVALYRIGKASKPPASSSNRKGLNEVLSS